MTSSTRRRPIFWVILVLALGMVASLFAPALSSRQSFASPPMLEPPAQKANTNPEPAKPVVSRFNYQTSAEASVDLGQPADPNVKPPRGSEKPLGPSAPQVKALPPIKPQSPRSPRATCTSLGSGGWNTAGTWSCGFVPTAADDVIIANGHTVTIDTAAVALNVTVGQGASGILQFDSAVAQSLTVGNNVTVPLGGTFQANPAGAITTHALSIGGNLFNDGTIDFSQNGNTSQVGITFTGASSATWTGNGGTNLKQTTGVTLNKGTSNASTLDFTPGTGTFTVQGGSALGFLAITNGTFKISGANTFSNPVFAVAAYSIPATGGFWLNNASATVVGQNGSPTNNGLLRITAGTFNMGTLGTNVMGAAAGALFMIEGGTTNVAGRLTSANAVTYTQSGGTVNICVAGGCATSPSFGFTSVLPTNVMNMSGGTINMVNSNTLTTADYNQQGRVDTFGGTVNFGTAATATNFNFRMQGNAPNVVVDNTTNNKTLLLSSTGYVYGTFTISTGTTFNPNALILNMLGSTFTNNGVITGCLSTSTLSRLQFSGAGAQSYTGTGTVCSAADPLFGFAIINRGSGVTIDPASPLINVARLLLFSGSLINTNKINLIQVGINVMVIQRGGVAFLPPGSADVAPTIPVATFLILVYSQGSTAVTTGVEIPASRTVGSLQDFNTNGITLAGGPLTVTGNAGAAPDSVGLFLGGTSAGVAGGVLNTSAANLITATGTSVSAVLGGSGMAYVNGPLARNLPASLLTGTTYVFPVGKSLYKPVELVNPTTGAAGGVTVQAEVFDTGSGGTNGAGLDAINTNRYWNVQITAGAGNFTNSSVRVTELNSTGNALGQSATQAGAYDSIGGTLAPATVLSTAPVTTLGYFVVGRLTGTPTFPGGTYTIGGGGTYPTLTAAMADLAGKIITGPILYSLLTTYTSGGETFPIVVPANGGSNATNTITIKPASGATLSISGSSASAILELLGADYVTVDGSNTVGGTTRDLTIQNTNVATLTAAVWVASQGANAGATFDTLKNLNVHAGLAGSTVSIFGIFAGGTTVATNGDDNDYLTIQNNAVDTAYEGITVRVATVLNGENDGLNINNNVVGNATTANSVTFRGISVLGAGSPVITQNETFNLFTTLISSNIAGIELGSTVYYAQVTRNKSHDIDNENTGQWGAYGIYNSTSTNNFGNSFVNNAIWGVTNYGYVAPSFSAVGIRIAGGSGHKVYFNSVNMYGAQTLSTGISAAFAADSTTDSGLNLRDNVFVNQITGGVKQYAAYVTSQTAFGTSALTAFGTSNYNDYYSTGTGNVGGFLNFFGVDHTTLPAYRASTQGDLNSISANPLFTSNSNLQPLPGSPVGGAGQSIAGITIDINGTTRPNPPSMGAYEVPVQGMPTPTSTGTAVATATSTSTSTATATSTVTATATSTATRTNTATNTSTSTSTSTATSSIPSPIPSGSVPPVATATPTACPFNYTITNSSGVIVPGTLDIGNHCDDCGTSIALPFPISLYGVVYNTATAGSNGYLAFGTFDNFFYSGCLPHTGSTYNIFPFETDQITGAAGKGIFTLVTGTAPNRTFYIEWRACRYNGATTCLPNSDNNYEIVFQEGQTSFSIVYGVFGTANATVGAIGVQRDTTLFTQSQCNLGAPPTTAQVYTPGACGTATSTVVASTATATATATATRTNTAVVPTNTPSNTPTNTAVVPTSTPSNTPTNTAVVPTNTPSNTPTNTAVVPTSTPSNTPTNTAVVPTSTRTNTVVGGTATPTACVANYTITNSSGVIVPGTLDIGNHCDDCGTSIALPFPISLYGVVYNTATAGSNGYLAFGTFDNFFYSGCLPHTGSTYNIFPFETDQITGAAGKGIFTLVTGTAPNRTFYIEWRACRYNGATTCLPNSDNNYEIVFQEGSSSFSIVYGTFGTANATVGAIGVQRDTTLFTQSQCNLGAPPTTAQVYTPGACGTATSTATAVAATATATATRTNTVVVPPTATRTNTAGVASPTPCAGGGGPIIVNGAITTSDPTQTGRLFRGGVASACGTPNPCSTIGGTYHYDLLGPYVNTTGSTVCITVQLDTACTGTNFIFSGGYVGPFNPALICTNNVGDAGLSPNGAPVTYGFNVPAGGTFYVNVAEVTANAGCAAYMVTITGLPGGACTTPTAGPSVTNTVVVPPTSTVTRTNTPIVVATGTPTNTSIVPPATSTRTNTVVVPPATSTSTNTPIVPPSTSTRTATAGVPTASPTICIMKFEDVHPEDWFYGYVEYLYCHGVISGYNTIPPCVNVGRICFKPGNNTTRGQMAKIVVRAFNFPINTTGGPHFIDVAPGSTFYTYIETGKNMGLFSGYADGTYRPNNDVTRGQIAKIIVNAAIIADPGNWTLLNPANNTFQDVPVGSTFYRHIETAAAHNILAGYPCGLPPAGPCQPGNRPYYLPGVNATRAQISKITYLAITFPPSRVK